MKLYEILKIDPEEVKVHLAQSSGPDDNPLDEYFAGKFKEGQEDQGQRNFKLKFILSLIRLNRNDLWLFAGVYLSHGASKAKEGNRVLYRTELTEIGACLRGRLIVQHKRGGRASYPYGKRLASAIVYEIKPEPLACSEFSNFDEVNLTRSQLELIYRHEYPSWKSVLSSVAGVYLLSDSKTGKLYVGSAYGKGGIWSRWGDYYRNYHGGNSRLKELYDLGDGDPSVFQTFNYSILETCHKNSRKDFVIEIENRWKSKLMTIKHGFNEK